MYCIKEGGTRYCRILIRFSASGGLKLAKHQQAVIIASYIKSTENNFHLRRVFVPINKNLNDYCYYFSMRANNF